MQQNKPRLKFDLDTDQGRTDFVLYAQISLAERKMRIEEALDLLNKFSKKGQEQLAQSFRSLILDHIYSISPSLSGDSLKRDLFNLYTRGAMKKIFIGDDVPIFSDLARTIIAEDKTTLKEDRLYTLFQSVINTRDVPGTMLELGVFRGGSLKFLAQVCEQLSVEKPIIGIDTFEGHPSVHPLDGPVHMVGKFSTTSLEQVTAYVEGWPNVRLVKGDVSKIVGDALRNVSAISFSH